MGTDTPATDTRGIDTFTSDTTTTDTPATDTQGIDTFTNDTSTSDTSATDTPTTGTQSSDISVNSTRITDTPAIPKRDTKAETVESEIIQIKLLSGLNLASTKIETTTDRSDQSTTVPNLTTPDKDSAHSGSCMTLPLLVLPFLSLTLLF